MAKIKVGIAGCLGRMGQELTKKILDDKNFIFVGGFEHKKHILLAQRSGISSAINEVINDFFDVTLYQNNAFLLCKSNYCWHVINQTLGRIPIH